MSTPGSVVVDLARRTIAAADGRRIPLTWHEFGLLAELIAARGEVRSRTDLSLTVLGRPHQHENRCLDQLVHNARRKMPPDTDGQPLIRSVRGVGFWVHPARRECAGTDRWVLGLAQDHGGGGNPPDAPQPMEAAMLPFGYRVLNDGPGREILVHEDWEECPVFASVAEAVGAARYYEQLA